MTRVFVVFMFIKISETSDRRRTEKYGSRRCLVDPLRLELSKTSATSLLASSVKFLPTSWPNGPQGSGHVAPPSYESIQEVL